MSEALKPENVGSPNEVMASAMATTTVGREEKKTQQTTEPKTDRKPQRARQDDKFKIFCGTANTALADEVCAHLHMPRGQATVTRFQDGETYVQLQENVRGADVFV